MTMTMNDWALIAALAMTLFWMVVGWRAMRAHERIAAAAEDLAEATQDVGKQLAKPKAPAGPARRPKPKPLRPFNKNP